MLPTKLKLSKSTDEQLRRLKGYIGVNSNVTARIAFFRSIESEFRYNGKEAKLDGSLDLNKLVWLGDTCEVTELVLKMYYPDFTPEQYQQAWAAHVEDGIASIRNHRSIADFSTAI